MELLIQKSCFVSLDQPCPTLYAGIKKKGFQGIQPGYLRVRG